MRTHTDTYCIHSFFFSFTDTQTSALSDRTRHEESTSQTSKKYAAISTNLSRLFVLF